MFEWRLLALLAVVVWTGCTNNDSHTGTRVGTETTLAARIVDGDGSPIVARVSLRRNSDLPFSMGGPMPLAESVADADGQVSVKVEHQNELLMLEVWNQDSTLAIWMDSLHSDALPTVIELLPTQGVSMFLGTTDQTGSVVDSAWLWFSGTDMVTTIAESPSTFAFVPHGAHSLSIRLSDDLHNPIEVRLEGFQVNVNTTDSVKFYLSLWELSTLQSGCILELLPGNVVPRDSLQQIVCQ